MPCNSERFCVPEAPRDYCLHGPAATRHISVPEAGQHGVAESHL